MISKIVKFFKKESKRLLALLLVATLVFSADVFHAMEIVYASVTESSESLDYSVEVESSSIEDGIIEVEEEKVGEDLIEGSSDEKIAKEDDDEEKIFGEENLKEEREDKSDIEEPEEDDIAVDTSKDEKEEEKTSDTTDVDDKEEDITDKEDKSLDDDINDDTTSNDKGKDLTDKKEKSISGDTSDDVTSIDKKEELYTSGYETSTDKDTDSTDKTKNGDLSELLEKLKKASASEVVEEEKTDEPSMDLFGTFYGWGDVPWKYSDGTTILWDVPLPDRLRYDSGNVRDVGSQEGYDVTWDWHEQKNDKMPTWKDIGNLPPHKTVNGWIMKWKYDVGGAIGTYYYGSGVLPNPGEALSYTKNTYYHPTKVSAIHIREIWAEAQLTTAPIWEISLDSGPGTSKSAIYAELRKYYSDNLCNTELTSLGNPGITTGGYIFEGWYTSRNTDYSVPSSGAECIFDKNGVLQKDATWITADTTLYACWSKVVHTVTLDKAGGTGGTDQIYVWYDQGKYSDAGVTIALSKITPPTKDNYAFDGYKDTSDMYINADGTFTSTFTNTSITGPKTLTAQWVPRYEITLNQNGGLGASPDVIYVKNGVGLYTDEACITAWDDSITKPTKPGYTFGGFGSNGDGGGTEYITSSGERNTTNFTKDSFTADKTIYAKWDPNVYHLTFNQDGGTGGTDDLWVKYNIGIYTDSTCGTSIGATIDIPTKANYLFAGYYDAGLSTKYVNVDGTRTAQFSVVTWSGDPAIDIEMKAKWVPVYKITLNKNGGDTDVDPREVYVTDGNGVNISAGVYTDKALTNKITNLTTLPTKAQNDFKGFNSEVDGTGTHYIGESGDILASFQASAFTGDTILYAKWVPAVYKITFNNDSATTVGTEALWVKYGVGIYTDEGCATAYTDPITKPTKTGYKYKGYYDDPEAASKVIYVNEDGTLNTAAFHNTAFTSNTEIKAKWENNIYTIDFDNNSATTPGTTNLWVKYNSGIYIDNTCTGAITVIPTKPTKEHYKFDGYYADNTWTTEYIDKDGNFTANFTPTTWDSDDTTTHITMVAKWELSIHKVELNNDGADIVGTTEVYEKYNAGIYADSSCSTPISNITVPVKAHYTFDGYYDETSLTTQYIDATGAITFDNKTFTEDVRIKAKWIPDVYMITLDDDGADVAGLPTIYEKYGVGFYFDAACTSVVTRVPKPAKGTSVCKGYFESVGGAGTRYIKEDGSIDTGVLTNTTITSDGTTLYAAYTDTKYVITLDQSGGDGGVSTLYKQEGGSVYTDDKCINLATRITTPTKRGKYFFAGYSTDSSGVGTMYVDSNGYVVMGAFPDSAITIYACWENSKGQIVSGGRNEESTIPIVDENGVIIRPSPYYDIVVHWDNDILQKDYTIIKDKSTNKYKYSVDDEPVLNKWVGEPGLDNKTNWHYVDANNVVTRGWQVINNSWYCFDNNGVMYTGSHVIDGQTYYFNETQNPDEGKLVVGVGLEKTNMNIIMAPEKTNAAFNLINKIVSWVKGIGKDDTVNISYNKKDSKYYYADGKQVANKWIGENDATGKTMWRYASNDGELWKGWYIVNDDWYFFDNNCVMLTGHQIINGVSLYFNEVDGINEGKLFKGTKM